MIGHHFMLTEDRYNLILKAETHDLAPSGCICLSLYDIDRKIMHTFNDQPGGQPIKLGAEIASVVADTLIVHSPFAIKTIETLYGFQIDKSRVIDTLALSKRLLGPYKNSLQDWSGRVGMYRTKFLGAPCWSPVAQQHCERDCLLIQRVLNYLSNMGV
jgi:hypothetical protein